MHFKSELNQIELNVTITLKQISTIIVMKDQFNWHSNTCTRYHASFLYAETHPSTCNGVMKVRCGGRLW